MLRLIATFALLHVISSADAAAGRGLSWLAGCWATPDKSAQEVWVIENDRSLLGFGIALANNSVSFYEILSIRQNDDGSFVYTAHPSGQASASFIATEISATSVVFTNPDHDYPQEITYVRDGDHLYATVSLLGGVMPTTFNKVACD
jgi:hypothetical protein